MGLAAAHGADGVPAANGLGRGRTGMTHNCRDCHFMASDLNMGGTIPKTLSKEQRELVEPQSGSTWGCYKRVWSTSSLPQDHSIGAAEKGAFKVQMLKDRRESCFFVEYQKGMEWPAAEDLQRLQYENRNLKKSFRNAKYALWVAVAGLMINALVGAANFFFK